MTAPVFIETTADFFSGWMGDYETRWMTEPPDKDASFRVIEEEWTEDYSVRTVYRWEPAEQIESRKERI